MSQAYEILPVIYAAMLPGLVKAAREQGYALAVHGSLKRDLDLVAIPWTEEAGTARELIEALNKAAAYAPRDRGELSKPERKPHGRMAWVVPLGCGLALDISVMPRKR